MAERLSATRLLCVLGAVAASPAAAAQAGLLDPTRPPTAASAEDGAKSGTPAAKAAPRLQSVLISPERRIAVIDGRTVPLGGQVGDALLVGISETGVTLRRGDHTEVLLLDAGVQKTRVAP